MANQMRTDSALFEHRASHRMQVLLQNKPQRVQNQSWLIVYLDVITLLLATFILLVNQPQQLFDAEAPRILEEKLQPAPVKSPIPEPTDDDADQLAESETPSPELQRNLAEQIRQQLLLIDEDGMVIDVEPGAVSLQLPESILFETGQSLLLPAADTLLSQLAPVLLSNEFPISVEGHTDDVPIFSNQFPSNWELSSARAGVVIRKLGELGVPYVRLKAIGYADTRPIDSNETEAGRSRNRRVNIVIHASAEQ